MPITDTVIPSQVSQYSDADAIAAVEAEATLALAGAVDVATGKIFSSDGLAMPATQVASANANTLDDYEEGDWTPALRFSAGSTGMTYSKQVGKYVKVGRIVHVNLAITLTAKGSSVGAAEIQSLPFVVGSNVNGGVGFGSVEGVLHTGLLLGDFNVTGSNIGLTELTDAGVLTGLSNTDFVDTSSIHASGSYHV